jgi:hypothetical protein
VWQSRSEGYSWTQVEPGKKFVAFYHHKFADERAYLITAGKQFYTTTDTGKTWYPFNAPVEPNQFGKMIMRFQPWGDHLLWIGQTDCDTFKGNCHTEAYYTWNNGREWKLVEKYVGNCAWAADHKINEDPTEILCESWEKKQGNQRDMRFSMGNSLGLVEGTKYFKDKKQVFASVIGFAKFSEYLVVAEVSLCYFSSAYGSD